MVTAETAVALPALVLVLTLLLQVAVLAVDQVRCVDAARAGARAAARGDDGRARALALAPPGSAVSVARGAGVVRVDVRAPARTGTGWLPGGGRAQARAQAVPEDALADGSVAAPDGAGP